MPTNSTTNSIAGEGIKPGNAARVSWYGQEGQATDIALLYLHGFTASPGEAGNLPEQMAAALSANLYVHRWPGHGLMAPTAMQGLTLEALQASALDALDIARNMGGRVVIVGSSLGATLGLWLASIASPAVAAVVAWSPGVRAADPALLDQFCAATEPLTDPRSRTPEALAYWSETTHPDGFRVLRSMFETFAAAPPWPRVVCPVFLGYYRSPSGEEDQTASVPAMLDMFDALGTPPACKEAVPYATGAHVIGSPYKSPIAHEVADASTRFLQKCLVAFASSEQRRVSREK